MKKWQGGDIDNFRTHTRRIGKVFFFNSQVAKFNDLVSSGKLNIKNFAAALRVNKTYLATLLQNPVPWSNATKLQKYIFIAAKNVVKQRTYGMESLTKVTPPPSQPSSPEEERTKLKRERLSEFQFNYLKDFFQVRIIHKCSHMLVLDKTCE